MDYTVISDADLELHLNTIINEKERRANVARIPGEIASLKQKFIEGGGDPAVLEPAAE